MPSASAVSSSAQAARSLPPNSVNQPPSLKPSSPSGSWTTPSSETFVLITIFPISVLLFVGLSVTSAQLASGSSPTSIPIPFRRPGQLSANWTAASMPSAVTSE